MIYSKRRKNLGGHTKRSNRTSYGLKRYSKNIANISGYRQKGGTGVVNWVKQKLHILDKDTIIRKFNKYNKFIQINENNETIKNKYNAKLEDLKENYKEVIEQIEAEKVAQEAQAEQAAQATRAQHEQYKQQKATRCETISKDIGTLDDYNRILEEAEEEAKREHYNGNLDNLNCLYEMKKWPELKAQADLDEFIKNNEGKTYVEMLEILESSESKERQRPNEKLIELFLEKCKDNYLKDLTAWMISEKYYGLSVKEVESRISACNHHIKYRSREEIYPIYRDIIDFKDKMKIEALSKILKDIKYVKSKQKEKKAKREAKENAEAMAELARKRETLLQDSSSSRSRSSRSRSSRSRSSRSRSSRSRSSRSRSGN